VDTVLTPEQQSVWLPSLDAVVHSRVFNTNARPRAHSTGSMPNGSTSDLHIGMVHGALAIPGKTDGDEVVFTEDEISRTGLDYLALGHWHSAIEGRAGNVTYAYCGAPEPVALDQDGAGQVLLVTLDDMGGRHQVSIEPRRVGQTRKESSSWTSARSRPAGPDRNHRPEADPNLVLDVRLTGIFRTRWTSIWTRWRELLALFPANSESATSLFRRCGGPTPPPDTSFVLRARRPGESRRVVVLSELAPLSGAPGQDPAEELADLREVLRLGRHLLEGVRDACEEGREMRILRLQLRNFACTASLTSSWRPASRSFRTERGRQVDDPAWHRTGPFPQGYRYGV